MKHGNKDALSSSASFLCFLPLSMSPAARASGGDCDCDCGRAVARSFNRPRLLAPRAARRPSVRSSVPASSSFQPPSCVRNLRLLFAGRLCSALLTGGGGDHVTVARVPARPLSPRAWSPTGDIEIQFPYSRNSSCPQLRSCICFLIHKCLRLSRPLSRVPYGQMEGRPDRWLVPSFAPLLVNTLEATGDGDGGPGIGERGGREIVVTRAPKRGSGSELAGSPPQRKCDRLLTLTFRTRARCYLPRCAVIHSKRPVGYKHEQMCNEIIHFPNLHFWSWHDE